MGRPHSPDKIEKARNLYVRDGLSLNQVSERLNGLPLSTLRGWAAKYGWDDMRRRQERKEEELAWLLVRIKLCLARLVLTEDSQDLAKGLDPKEINALCKVVAVLSPPAAVQLKIMEKQETGSQSLSVEERMTKVREFLEGN